MCRSSASVSPSGARKWRTVMAGESERQKRATIPIAIEANVGSLKNRSASNPRGLVIPRTWALSRPVMRGPFSLSRIGLPNSA